MPRPLPPRIALPLPVAKIYEAVEELSALYPGRPFTPDGHLVGSIGEVIAAEALGLKLYPPSQPGHDAYDENGDVQIKLTAGKAISMYATCERLVVLRIVSPPREAEIAYDGPGDVAWANAGRTAKNGQRRISLARLQKLQPNPEIKPAHKLARALYALPPEINARSGSVFYSGTAAFAAKAPVYILGLNPGGCPAAQADETIQRDIDEWRSRPRHWSRYLDESWQGALPGAHGMQPRVAHLLSKLELDPHTIPASNVVFVRSVSEAELRHEMTSLLPLCWTFHAEVISSLEVQTILCLGGTAGKWTRKMLGADTLLGQWTERNGRDWKSTAHLAPGGRVVLTLPHPSRADWRNPAADPSEFVRQILDR